MVNDKKITKQKINDILNNSDEYKSRIRYAYWVSDGKGWGSYKLMKSVEEVPKGKPFHVAICML